MIHSDVFCAEYHAPPRTLTDVNVNRSSQMEPAQRMRTISGQHDTQLALHQQYLNYRRHSLDIFTFQNPHIRNHLTSSNVRHFSATRLGATTLIKPIYFLDFVIFKNTYFPEQ